MHPPGTDDCDNGSGLSLGIDRADGLVACRIERDSDVVEQLEPDAREYGNSLLMHRPEAFDHRVVDHVVQRSFEVVDDREPQRGHAAAFVNGRRGHRLRAVWGYGGKMPGCSAQTFHIRPPAVYGAD